MAAGHGHLRRTEPPRRREGQSQNSTAERPHGTEGATVIARAAASTARSPLAKPGKILSLAWSVGVEPRGLEPLTPTLPVWCATSCATAPTPAPGHPRNST